MDSVSRVVNDMLDTRGWRPRVLEEMAVLLWPEVVGPYIAPNSHAQSFRNGTLNVRVRSPQWVQEIHFQKPRIIARINGKLQKPIVQKIRCFVTPPRGIKVGALKPNWEDPTFPEDVPVPASYKREKIPIDDEAAHRAREMAATIEDETMRTTMERLIATSIRAKEKRELAEQQRMENPEPEAPKPAPAKRRR